MWEFTIYALINNSTYFCTYCISDHRSSRPVLLLPWWSLILFIFFAFISLFFFFCSSCWFSSPLFFLAIILLFIYLFPFGGFGWTARSQHDFVYRFCLPYLNCELISVSYDAREERAQEARCHLQFPAVCIDEIISTHTRNGTDRIDARDDHKLQPQRWCTSKNASEFDHLTISL